jgi:hypothetical protein
MSQPGRWCSSTNNPSTHTRSALLGKLVAHGLFLDASLEQHGWGIHVVWTPQAGNHATHGSRKGIPQTTGAAARRDTSRRHGRNPCRLASRRVIAMPSWYQD